MRPGEVEITVSASWHILLNGLMAAGAKMLGERDAGRQFSAYDACRLETLAKEIREAIAMGERT